MKLLLSFILAVILSVASYGQSNDCETAIPFVDNDCALFFPSPTSITRCFSFNSPSTYIDFNFIPFVPQGTCGDAVSWYTLYDSNCNLDTINLDGLYTDLQPNGDYVVCYTVQCPTTGVINFLCNQELIILPIDLIYFTAEATPSSVDLKWSTASQSGCAGFFLERSADLSNWLNIGYVEGSINSQQTERYLFKDLKPIEGVNYYRLTEHSIDGRFEVLQIIAIVWNKEVQTSPFRQYNFLGQKVAP